VWSASVSCLVARLNDMNGPACIKVQANVVGTQLHALSSYTYEEWDMGKLLNSDLYH